MVTRGKTTEAELAYAAGIIDGEGCLTINRSNTTKQRRTSVRYQPELVVVNGSKAVLDWLQERFGGSIVPRKRTQEHWKPSWAWKLGDRKAAAVLAEVAPYMIIKRKQAEMVIRFFSEAQTRKFGRGVEVTPDELLRREQMYREIREANDSRHPQRLSGGALTQPVSDATV